MHEIVTKCVFNYRIELTLSGWNTIEYNICDIYYRNSQKFWPIGRFESSWSQSECAHMKNVFESSNYIYFLSHSNIALSIASCLWGHHIRKHGSTILWTQDIQANFILACAYASVNHMHIQVHFDSLLHQAKSSFSINITIDLSLLYEYWRMWCIAWIHHVMWI